MILTNSERGCFRQCPRKWKYQYEDQRIPVQSKEYFVFGSAMGLGLDAIWEGREYGEDFKAYLTEHAREDRQAILYYKGMAMLKGYVANYPTLFMEWEVLKTEHTVSMDLGNDLTFTGQIDKVARNKKTGRLAVIDHKTSSEDIDDLSSQYWESVNYIDPQTAGYRAALEEEFGEEVDIFYDVIKKEGSKGPKMKSVVRKRKDETQEDFEMRKADNLESWDEYGARIADLYLENDQWYQFQQVVKTKDDMNDWRREFIADAGAIQHCIDSGVYPKVTFACGRRDQRCEYVTVCAKINSLDSDDFKDKGARHPELTENS